MVASGREEDRIREVYAARAERGEAGRYRWDLPDVQLRRWSWHRALAWALAGAGGLEGRRVLDLGCGGGDWLAVLASWGMDPAGLVGIELLAERTVRARRAVPGAATILRASGYHLPLAADSMPLILASTVFSSILEAEARAALAAEIQRVLVPGGSAIIYDFRYDNPRNHEVRGFSQREVAACFPGCRLRWRRTTLAPPLARRLAPISMLAAQALEAWVPALRSHALYLLTKAA